MCMCALFAVIFFWNVKDCFCVYFYTTGKKPFIERRKKTSIKSGCRVCKSIFIYSALIIINICSAVGILSFVACFFPLLRTIVQRMWVCGAIKMDKYEKRVCQYTGARTHTILYIKIVYFRFFFQVFSVSFNFSNFHSFYVAFLLV